MECKEATSSAVASASAAAAGPERRGPAEHARWGGNAAQWRLRRGCPAEAVLAGSVKLQSRRAAEPDVLHAVHARALHVSPRCFIKDCSCILGEILYSGSPLCFSPASDGPKWILCEPDFGSLLAPGSDSGH